VLSIFTANRCRVDCLRSPCFKFSHLVVVGSRCLRYNTSVTKHTDIHSESSGLSFPFTQQQHESKMKTRQHWVHHITFTTETNAMCVQSRFGRQTDAHSTTHAECHLYLLHSRSDAVFSVRRKPAAQKSCQHCSESLGPCC